MAIEGLEELADQNSQKRNGVSQFAQALMLAGQTQKGIDKAVDKLIAQVLNVNVKNQKDKVKVGNLDEVKLHLRTELTRALKMFLKDFKNSVKLDDKQLGELQDQFDFLVVRKPKTEVSVTNFPDFPDSLKVSNLQELQELFDKLGGRIEDAFDIEIPKPEVTVNVPDQPTPEVNLNPLLSAIQNLGSRLNPLNLLSRDANKPISVRMSDGKKFINALKGIEQQARKQVQAFSQGLNEASARKAFKQALDSKGISNLPISVGVAGAKALTDNTAGVALAADTSCTYVDITAYGGIISIGDSTSTRVDASANGIVLTPGSTMYRVVATNLNQVFASGATGSRACFIYYV